MLEAYKIGIRISLINNVSEGLKILANQLGVAGIKAKELQARIDGIKTSMRTGAVTFGAGAVLAAPIIYAIDKAAQLQKQMIGVRLATAGTAGEMEKMRSVIEATASRTIFSNIDVAKMAKLIATGTGLNAQQVTGLLPQYAKFADVQYLMKGTSYDESVKEAIRLAHTAKKYDPASLSKYLDLLTKVSFMVPGSLGEVGHALKYSQGVAGTALGISDENMVLLTALLNRLGFAGSRGGTNLIAAMTRTIPGVFGSGLLKGKSASALRAMGMVDEGGHSVFLENGKFDAFGWMRGLSMYVNREMARNPEGVARQNIMTNFQHAFGSQGARVASLLADPQALTQLSMLGGRFAEMPGAASIQGTFADESVAQKWENAKTNFVSLMTELGYKLLPVAADVLTKLNTGLGWLIKAVTESKTAVTVLVHALLALSVGLMFRGSVILLTSALKGLGLVMEAGSGVAGAAAITRTATALGVLGKAVGVLGRLAVAGGIGWEIGSAIYENESPDHQYQGGRNVAQLLAFFGNKEAQEALDADDRYIRSQQKSNMIHTTINMDGRKVAEAVTHHQVRSGSVAAHSGGSIDPNMQPLFPGVPPMLMVP